MIKSLYLPLVACMLLSVSTINARCAESASDAAGTMPEHWLYQPTYTQTAPSDDAWWKQYGDAVLDSLISKAERNNYNVAAAIKRIKLAERQIASARASLYPTLDVSAGWTRAQSAGAVSSPSTASHTDSYYNAGANISWEIDIFGRVAAKTKAAKAQVGVSRAEYDAVMVALCADIASAYFELRTTQEQYAVALAHIEMQEKVVNMTEIRNEAGIGNELEVSQAKTVLNTTRATLPSLESAMRTQINSIAVLTGEYPTEEFARILMGNHTLATAPPLAVMSAPMELLRRRPDIAEAEQQLAQYAASVGVAKKDFLPVLTLNGSIGTSAHAIGDMFVSHSLEYSVAPTLSWTVFDGFARKNNVAQARLQFEAAMDDYNMTVLTAYEEVENAVSQYNSAVERVKVLKDVVEESERSYRLSIELYKDGLTDFINVTNSQLTFLENKNSLTQANGNVYAAQVAIYQALGGGLGN